jgi:large subunit ribosomal protein L23
MALFSRKKNKETTDKKTADKKAEAKSVVKKDKKAKKPSASAKSSKKSTSKAVSTSSAKPMSKREIKTAAKKVVRKPHHASRVKSPKADLSNVIRNPRITEKGAILATDKRIYVFDIANDATKTDVKAAIEQIYKVSPKKVTVAQVPDKKVRVRGHRRKTGVKSGGKKAYVFLKDGDKIEFV